MIERPYAELCTNGMNAPKFLELKPREEVLEVIRASLAPSFGKFFLLVLWLALPFFFLFPLWRAGTSGIGAFVVWVCSGIILLWRAYVCWERTALVITDGRVVDHDQQGFFYRVVTEARFHQIDEVSFRIKGLWATIFRYGTLNLQLTGSSADIEVEHVRHPSRIADLLNDLREPSAQPRRSL